MTIAVTLDLETLSTRPDAVILSLGAIKFNPYSLEPHYEELEMRLDVDEQLSMGRHVMDSTMEWWGSQSPEVQEAAFGDENRISVADFMRRLNKFVNRADEIWCQGPVFDIGILENLYRQMETPSPWQYWSIRDSRTLFKVFGERRNMSRTNAHNAVADCIAQSRGIQEIIRQYNIKP